MEHQQAIQTKKRNRFMPWLWLILAVGYTLSPIDLVPDTIPVLGWLDDLSLIAAAISNLFQKYHEDTHRQLARVLKYFKWLLLLFALLLILFILIFAFLGYITFFS